MSTIHVPTWVPQQRERRPPVVVWVLTGRRLIRREMAWLALGALLGTALTRRRAMDAAIVEAAELDVETDTP